MEIDNIIINTIFALINIGIGYGLYYLTHKPIITGNESREAGVC